MKGTTYEATVQDGRVVLAEDAHIPDNTRVYVVVPEADVVLVLGSQNSSNSQRLAEISRQHNRPAYLIDGVGELRDEWFAGARTVLVTAGASAPEDVVEATVNYLRNRFDAEVESRTVREEHVNFPLPRELRGLPVVS